MSNSNTASKQSPIPSLPKNTYEVKQMLNALSKEVFGTSSRWQKLVNDGFAEVVTDEVIELVPRDDDSGESDERTVRVPRKTASGAVQSIIKRHTVESVYELMVNLKQRREMYLALMQQQKQAETRRKEEEKLRKQVQENAAGSAILG